MNCSRTFPEGQAEPVHDGTPLGGGVFVLRLPDGSGVRLCAHQDPGGRDDEVAELELTRSDIEAVLTVLDPERIPHPAVPASGVAVASEGKVVGAIAPAPEPIAPELATEATTPIPGDVAAVPSEPPTTEGSGAPPA